MAKRRTKRQQRSGLSQYLTTERVIIGGIVGVTVLIILVFAINALINAPVGDIDGVVETFGLARDHVENADYQAVGLPPTGGEHSAAWQNCGIYDVQVNLENAVHSLEHGAVWLTYRPDLVEADDIAMLKGKMRGGTHRLMSPYPDQNSPIVLTGWGVQLELEDADDERVDLFIRKYEKGPQTPEPGAVCFNGVGNPTG